MNIKTFELAPEQLHIRKLLSKDFLELEIYAISDDYPKNYSENRHINLSVDSTDFKPVSLGEINKLR